MEDIRITNLNVEKKTITSLQSSGVITLKEVEHANLHKLHEDITQLQVDKIRTAFDDVKEISDSYSKFLKNPVDIGKGRQRQTVQLVRDPGQEIEEGGEEYFLDEVFGLGEVIEIVGPSACGKGQIGYQLCLNSQIPKELGGIEGEALYVDTNGDFCEERVLEMAKCFRMKLMKSLGKDDELDVKLKEKYTEEKILERIYHFRIMDEDDQTSFFISLEKILKSNKKIKCIYYDPINIHCSKAERGYQERKRIINNVLIHFLRLSKRFQVCFVLTNILKSVRKFYKESEPTTKLEPNYGEILFQSCTNRVHIDRDSKIGDDIFKATLTKGSMFYERTKEFHMHFQVKESGISGRIS
ncbi:unnamed protein product [Moneuplotes crassus]|uniref:Rad51-like C-terminal domain-containing protein n=1 Tax=Euplotes crassus TaxID=5936 RepID=A0AAD1XLD9_EUPCR|nr:unnamed protein product [Moneuplotes crassus]